MNATWHKKHRMPKNPTPQQRLDWHLAHAKACKCREMPASVLAELRRQVTARRKRSA
jgi:hypothetical protein